MSIILDAVHVRVEYGSFVALPSFSLQLAGGQLLGLVGPNGAGKTTAMKAIAGILPHTAGTIRVLDTMIEPESGGRRAAIGFAPDTPQLYEDLTVVNFLRFIGLAYSLKPSMIEERIDLWLEQLWLTDRRDAKIKSLSRGMKQRLTVARTLLPDPALVLLDEPAAGLDPAGRVQFRQMLASLRDMGKALIVSSHILADLHEYCTHIAIMAGGQIIQFGTVAQVVGAKQDNRCRYQVRLARPIPDTGRILSGFERISDAKVDGTVISFEFEHDPEAAAGLLRSLLAAELPVAAFSPIAHDLEQAYLRTGIRQVD